MVIVLVFILAGVAPETLAVVRDLETCESIAKVVNANLSGGKVICTETKVSKS